MNMIDSINSLICWTREAEQSGLSKDLWLLMWILANEDVYRNLYSSVSSSVYSTCSATLAADLMAAIQSQPALISYFSEHDWSASKKRNLRELHGNLPKLQGIRHLLHNWYILWKSDSNVPLKNTNELRWGTHFREQTENMGRVQL